MTVNVTCRSFEFETNCMSDIGLFLFLLIRLPSSRRCGLAETVGLCFRVDSNLATSVFVLGLVCVCVCSVLLCCLFVVG